MNDWLLNLAAVDPCPHVPWLSPQGARAAWAAALQPLPALSAFRGNNPGRVVIVAAGTVFTAPIEVVAATLALGGTAVWKTPAGQPGVAEAVAAADPQGRIAATDRRNAADDADTVVVMGSDETVAEIRKSYPNKPVLGFGHKFSIAWMVGDDWTRLAEDVALHDGRGCLSPSVVFTPRSDGVERLSDVLAAAQRAWPVGQVTPAEGAAIRARSALARLLGEARKGAGGSVHRLPVSHIDPAALPRAPLLVQVDSPVAANRALAAWAPWLSSVATDDSTVRAWPGASRVCAPGQLQRPPIPRLWDGHRWPDALSPS